MHDISLRYDALVSGRGISGDKNACVAWEKVGFGCIIRFERRVGGGTGFCGLCRLVRQAKMVDR